MKGEKRDKESKSGHKHKKKKHSDRHDGKHHSKSKKHSKKENKKSLRDVDCTLTSDDYFVKSEEFRVWLKIDRDRPFEELDSSYSHKLFKEFCEKWNHGELPDMYYSGIPPEIRHECMRTQHRWGIKLSASEKAEVTELADRVDINTRKPSQNAWNHMAPPQSTSSATVTRERRSAPPQDACAREEEKERYKKQRKIEHQHERKRRDVVLEEVAPRETGRDAIMDKRKEIGNRLRGAAADKEDGIDGLNMSESVTMGGGDDFASVKARMERGKERREEKKFERIRELKERDAERQQNFMAQLGVDLSAGPIRIAPRTDN